MREPRREKLRRDVILLLATLAIVLPLGALVLVVRVSLGGAFD